MNFQDWLEYLFLITDKKKNRWDTLGNPLCLDRMGFGNFS